VLDDGEQAIAFPHLEACLRVTLARLVAGRDPELWIVQHFRQECGQPAEVEGPRTRSGSPALIQPWLTPTPIGFCESISSATAPSVTASVPQKTCVVANCASSPAPPPKNR